MNQRTVVDSHQVKGGDMQSDENPGWTSGDLIGEQYKSASSFSSGFPDIQPTHATILQNQHENHRQYNEQQQQQHPQYNEQHYQIPQQQQQQYRQEERRYLQDPEHTFTQKHQSQQKLLLLQKRPHQHEKNPHVELPLRNSSQPEVFEKVLSTQSDDFERAIPFSNSHFLPSQFPQQLSEAFSPKAQNRNATLNSANHSRIVIPDISSFSKNNPLPSIAFAFKSAAVFSDASPSPSLFDNLSKSTLAVPEELASKLTESKSAAITINSSTDEDELLHRWNKKRRQPQLLNAVTEEANPPELLPFPLDLSAKTNFIRPLMSNRWNFSKNVDGLEEEGFDCVDEWSEADVHRRRSYTVDWPQRPVKKWIHSRNDHFVRDPQSWKDELSTNRRSNELSLTASSYLWADNERSNGTWEGLPSRPRAGSFPASNASRGYSGFISNQLERHKKRVGPQENLMAETYLDMPHLEQIDRVHFVGEDSPGYHPTSHMGSSLSATISQKMSPECELTNYFEETSELLHAQGPIRHEVDQLSDIPPTNRMTPIETMSEIREPTVSAIPTASSSGLECKHCRIIFPDYVLYALHMGYHAHADPFLCNKCGERSSDHRQFFMHIARVAHE